MPIKAADIVVRRVNDFHDGGIRQKVSKRSNIRKSYRIDDAYFVTRGNLNEAELLGIKVKAVGFRIQSDDP